MSLISPFAKDERGGGKARLAGLAAGFAEAVAPFDEVGGRGVGGFAGAGGALD